MSDLSAPIRDPGGFLPANTVSSPMLKSACCWLAPMDAACDELSLGREALLIMARQGLDFMFPLVGGQYGGAGEQDRKCRGMKKLIAWTYIERQAQCRVGRTRSTLTVCNHTRC